MQENTNAELGYISGWHLFPFLLIIFLRHRFPQNSSSTSACVKLDQMITCTCFNIFFTDINHVLIPPVPVSSSYTRCHASCPLDPKQLSMQLTGLNGVHNRSFHFAILSDFFSFHGNNNQITFIFPFLGLADSQLFHLWRVLIIQPEMSSVCLTAASGLYCCYFHCSGLTLTRTQHLIAPSVYKSLVYVEAQSTRWISDHISCYFLK